MPREVTESEMRIYNADFEKFDTNKNGALDAEECKALCDFQLSREASHRSSPGNNAQILR